MAKVESATDIKRGKSWEKSLWGCGFLCVYFKNAWHARRADNDGVGATWASGAYADDGDKRGAQLMQGQRFGFGIFGFNFILYELVGGVRSMRAYKNPSGLENSMETDHAVWDKVTFMGMGIVTSGGNSGWVPFQWDSNVFSTDAEAVAAGGAPDLTDGYCHVLGQPQHCTSSQQCSLTSREEPFVCEGGLTRRLTNCRTCDF